MLASSTPAKFSIPFAAGAGAGFIRPIPVASQIGVNPGFASLTDGFPPLNFTPVAAGGVPPFGSDVNGLLNQVTLWNQWHSAGAPIYYDAVFATGPANGYPNGAVLQSAVVPGNFWLSVIDNNTSNPDAGGANWVPLPGMAQTGDVKWWVGPTVPPGWVAATPGNTIGSLSSGAAFAGSTAQFLYAFFWNNFSNTQCPVTGGRGANAAADFAANKKIVMINLAGTMLIGNDSGAGILTGVPVIFGPGANSNGSYIGEPLHTLTAAQIPSHTHNGSGTTVGESANHQHIYSGNTGDDTPDHNHNFGALQGGASPAGITTGGVASGVISSTTTTGGANQRHIHPYSGTTSIESNQHTHAYSFTTDGGTGGGGAHNTTPRSMVGTWIIKL